MGRAVGIDLGTTYSAVAAMDYATGKVEILENAEGEATTPSVVFFQDIDGDDEPLVGSMAKHMAGASPDNVVQFVKRNMGNPNWRFESATGNQYTAEEVSAIILKKLKQDAELKLGEEITDAVITVPAYFDDARRIATKQAGKIAGLNVLRVLNEPTAAAISYGLDTDKDGTVLVYDLGGGTFDVTILRIKDLHFEVVGTDGDRNLGGFDFDNELMKFIADDVVRQGGANILDGNHFEAMAELREKAEVAKRTLSNVAKTNVFVALNGKNYRTTVTRKDFERITRSLLTRTEELVQDVLDDTGTTWDQIDHVLLIGGSTRMPMVRELVERMSGKTPETDVNPDEAVALGAAVQATLEVANGNSGEGDLDAASFDAASSSVFFDKDIQIRDVTSQALGLLILSDDQTHMENSTIIERNIPIPASCTKTYATVEDNQTALHVQVTQGEDPDPQFVVVIGESTLKIPPHPAGSPIEVTYYYDVDQTVQIEVKDLTINQSLGSFEIDRVANMSDDDVARAADKMQAMNVE